MVGEDRGENISLMQSQQTEKNIARDIHASYSFAPKGSVFKSCENLFALFCTLKGEELEPILIF